MAQISLPVELYRPIARHIGSKGALCAFARVSRLTQVEAERLIYTELTADTVVEIVVLLRRIISLRRITPYVSSLTVRRVLAPLNQPGQVSVYPRPIRPFFQLLASVLSLLTELRHLVINFLAFDKGVLLSAPSIFNHASFKLRSFTCSFLVNAGIVQFLINQPDIEHLSLLNVNRYSSMAIPNHAVPKLRALNTLDDQYSWDLLLNRHLTHLWMAQIPRSTEGRDLRTLRVLKLHGRIPRNLPDLTPDLEVLCEIDIHASPIEKLTPILSNMKRLKEIELFGRMPSMEDGSIVTQLHTICPSLRTVNCRMGRIAFPETGLFYSWEGHSWAREQCAPPISLWDLSVSMLFQDDDGAYSIFSRIEGSPG